jgi:translation initiation factor 3 subunit B
MDEHKLEQEIDFSDLEAKYATSPDDGLEAFVIVDGCPIIPESKVAALSKVLKKLFNSVGTVKEDGFFMPVEGGKTKGFAFIEYQSPQEAAAAVSTYHNKKLDQKHTLLVNKLGDVERFGFKGNVSQDYVEPSIDEFKPREHLRSWLTDSQGRDQMVLHKGDFVGIYWNKKSDAPEQVVNRLHWTEKYVKWSPLGTYLVSVHRQGVQIWGGASWAGLGKFPHSDVRMVDFSPNENFLVTWSAEPITLPPIGDPARNRIPFKEKDEGNSIVIWDTKTFIPLRTFPLHAGGKSQAADKEKKVVWPIFKWSADSKYFCRVIPGEALAIYEAPSMGLLDKKPLLIPGIMDFEFAPSPIKLEGRKAEEQLVCYWTPEMPNQTARVSIMSIPSKEVVRSRNLFNVSGCRLHWQDEGRFLCVKVDRHTKSKKSTYTNLEFFRLKEKDIPVEVLELKETVINFQWEPKSDRFVLISFLDSVPPGPNRNIVSFYALERNKGAKGAWKLLKRI